MERKIAEKIVGKNEKIRGLNIREEILGQSGKKCGKLAKKLLKNCV
jgi:hypothetical protein